MVKVKERLSEYVSDWERGMEKTGGGRIVKWGIVGEEERGKGSVGMFREKEEEDSGEKELESLIFFHSVNCFGWKKKKMS